MRTAQITLLLLMMSLLVTGSGCSTSRTRQLAGHADPSTNARQSERAVASDAATQIDDADDAPAIAPVSFSRPTGADGPTPADASAADSSDPAQAMAAQLLARHPQPNVEGLTLASLENLALQNNPSIQQVSAAAARATGMQTQVGLKPNPSVGYFGEEIGNEGAGGLNGAFVSQTFVRGDKLAWNRQVVGHEVNAMMWQVEAQRYRVRTDIRVQFYAALVAQNRLRLAREFRDVAAHGVRVSEDRLRIKVGARPDVLQSQIQLNEVDLMIRRAELELQAAWNELAATAGVPSLMRTSLIGEFDVSAAERELESTYQQIVASSPLVAAAQARVDRARSNLQRQQLQPIPNLTAQLGAGYDDATGDEFANVQLSLPLPLHNRNQGNISAAYAEYCEASQNVQRLRLQIRRDLARVIREYQVARATVDQYESSILPKARESLELIQEAQEAGQFDFLRVLTARRMFFDVNLEYVTAQGELSQADARLDGLLLTGGLEPAPTTNVGDELRGQSLNGM